MTITDRPPRQPKTARELQLVRVAKGWSEEKVLTSYYLLDWYKLDGLRASLEERIGLLKSRLNVRWTDQMAHEQRGLLELQRLATAVYELRARLRGKHHVGVEKLSDSQLWNLLERSELGYCANYVRTEETTTFRWAPGKMMLHGPKQPARILGWLTAAMNGLKSWKLPGSTTDKTPV